MKQIRTRSRLEVFLFEQGITYQQAGERLGVSGQLVHLVATGKRKASPAMAKKIGEWMTGQAPATGDTTQQGGMA